jgi:OOP family OmpA-OmpF porin
MKSKNILAILSVLALSAPMASATDWYVGAGGGRANFNGNELDLEPSRLATETYALNNLDKSSTGWKLFAGRQLNENWAVEFAYTKLGKFYFDATINAGPGPGPYPIAEYAEAEPDCWSLSGVGFLPLGNNFSLLGKAGLCRWDDHAYAREGLIEYTGPMSTGTNLTYGIGAKYDFADNLGVRAEWERFEKAVHHRSSVDLLSVSLQYGF